MSPSPLDLEFARQVLTSEAEALAGLLPCVNDRFAEAVRIIHDCTRPDRQDRPGQVVVTGIGKAGLVGAKISATMASTGTPSIFLHPTEALHGDLGRLQRGDVVLALSHSGATQELLLLLDHLKGRGAKLVAITGNEGSPLAAGADVAVVYGPVREACVLGLAPSVSTTCMLALGDALALTAMRMRDFSPEDFAAFHPGGSLGRQLMKVEEAMTFRKGERLALAMDSLTVREVLMQAEKIARRAGAVLLVDSVGRLTGILTDADVRRHLLKDADGRFLRQPVAEIMHRNPKCIRVGSLASEALAIMNQYRIDELPVLDSAGCPAGMVDVQDLVGLRTVANGKD